MLGSYSERKVRAEPLPNGLYLLEAEICGLVARRAFESKMITAIVQFGYFNIQLGCYATKTDYAVRNNFLETFGTS